eukprot:6173543-Pleurochrysis_carterae.AAC.2
MRKGDRHGKGERGSFYAMTSTARKSVGETIRGGARSVKQERMAADGQNDEIEQRDLYGGGADASE